MFKTRLLSSVLLVVLMILAIFAGNTVFTALFAAISLIGMYEIYRIYGIHRSALGVTGYVIALIFDGLLYCGMAELAEMVLVAGLIVIMAVYVITFPKYQATQTMASYFGFVYVAVMLSFIFRIRAMDNGIVLIWLVFICSWINDTCAYLVGITLGRHKMTPKLSPKKSWEGAVGGVCGTAIVATLYGWIFRAQFDTIINPSIVCGIACSLGAILSVFGDLAASAIKRNHEVKDYGNLIPGHGGIMDRFDSMIFIAPVIFWVINFMS
ncbi:MAG: phosphatidate cytidylyltransferase [Lachnospiraceae bacterium]